MRTGPDPFNLTGEVAVVVGGTSGVGATLSEALAGAGAGVAVLGRDRERGERCVGQIVGKRGLAKFYAADESDSVSLVAAHRSIRDQLGSPSILVNIAAEHPATAAEERAFEEISAADWRESFDVSLVGGALLACQEFGPAMVVRGKGSIINLAGISTPLSSPSRTLASSAAKAAMTSLTQFLARAWAPHGVRVNSLTAGFIAAGPGYDLLCGEDGKPNALGASILGRTPMGRFGEPAELTGAAIFLASSRASAFVTGIDLRVDGGFLAQPS